MDKTFFKEEYQQKLALQFEEETGKSATREITNGVHMSVQITVWNYEFINWLMKKCENEEFLEHENSHVHKGLVRVNAINKSLSEKYNNIMADNEIIMSKYRKLKSKYEKERKKISHLEWKIEGSIDRINRYSDYVDRVMKRNRRLVNLLKAYRGKAENVLFYIISSLPLLGGKPHNIFKD